MNARNEREYIKSVYPNPTWSKKVDQMRDDQVIAIFLQLRFSPIKPPRQEPNNPLQLRLF